MKITHIRSEHQEPDISTRVGDPAPAPIPAQRSRWRLDRHYNEIGITDQASHSLPRFSVRNIRYCRTQVACSKGMHAPGYCSLNSVLALCR
jgi:hypothetical protein